MRSCKKIGFCFIAHFALLAACSDRQDKIGWEPEVAIPLVQLVVDLNEKVDMADYTRGFFNLAGLLPNGQKMQSDMLYTALTEYLNKAANDSVKKRLPSYLQNDVDVFVSQYNSSSVPEYGARVLMWDLLDKLVQNKSVTAVNNFTYYVLKNLPGGLHELAVDSLCNRPIPEMRAQLGLDMSTLTEKADKLQRLTLQLTVSTRLKVDAQVQLYLFDSACNSASCAYDSLFHERRGQMYAGSAGDENKLHVTRPYPTPEAAQHALRAQTVSLLVKSDSLGLDTSLMWLKDLHNRKIHASVGIMFKANLDDMIK